jgi:hypothetical protein
VALLPAPKSRLGLAANLTLGLALVGAAAAYAALHWERLPLEFRELVGGLPWDYPAWVLLGVFAAALVGIVCLGNAVSYLVRRGDGTAGVADLRPEAAYGETADAGLSLAEFRAAANIALFRVAGTLTLRSQKLFVIYGDVTEGHARPGMRLSIPLTSGLGVSTAVHGVETLEGLREHAYTGLVIPFRTPAELEFWKELDLHDAVLELTAPRA